MGTKADDKKLLWVNYALKTLNPIRFKGALYYSLEGTTTGYEPFNRQQLADALYAEDMSLAPSIIDHVLDTLRSVAPDRSDLSHLIAFGDKVWDMHTADFTDTYPWVYASGITPHPDTEPARAFLLQLSNQDAALAFDYLQAFAPMFLKTRPIGVIWLIGDGANGKSTLLKAMKLIVGDKYIASLTAAEIEDGKRTPELNGKLANIVDETSEQRIEDTSTYKSIGAHQSFQVRKYYTQESITVDGDLHHVFNANNIPSFSDKTKGARRRTLVIPFPAHFADDPTFEERTLTPEFLGGLLTLVLEAAQAMRDNGYRYQWSAATLKAKEAYDQEVNSAEAYLRHLISQGVQGFYNWGLFQRSYEIWCDQNSNSKVFPATAKRAVIADVAPVQRSVRTEDGKVTRYWYFQDVVDPKELVWFDNGYAYPAPAAEAVAAQVESERLSDEW